MSEALLALAERVEQATGPDRELDMQIKAAVHGAVALLSPFNGEWCLYRLGTTDPRGGKLFERPRNLKHEDWASDRYTASLDAAMALVPEGWRTAMAQQGIDGDDWSWRLGEIRDDLRGRPVDASSATAPLAITAAALRARAENPHV